MANQTIFDFIILILILGVVAFAAALGAHYLKCRRRQRIIDPIDHRKWKKKSTKKEQIVN